MLLVRQSRARRCAHKKVMVLLLETGDEKECVKNEKILFVDSDYDEIMMYNN